MGGNMPHLKHKCRLPRNTEARTTRIAVAILISRMDFSPTVMLPKPNSQPLPRRRGVPPSGCCDVAPLKSRRPYLMTQPALYRKQYACFSEESNCVPSVSFPT